MIISTLLLTLIQPAGACDGYSSLAWVTPPDATADVPTDARFVATMGWGGGAGLVQATLTDAAGSYPVTVTSQVDHSDDSIPGLGIIEIVPVNPLVSGVTYTLSVTDIQDPSAPDTWVRTFTAGNGPAAPVGAPPVLSYVEIGDVVSYFDSCSFGDYRTIEVCAAPSQVGSADELELLRIYRLEDANDTTGLQVKTMRVPTDGAALSMSLFTEWGANPDECFVATLQSASGVESPWSNMICFGVDPEIGQCVTIIPVDSDGDGFAEDVDCDDQDAAIYPGAVEIYYDNVDQNCDGLSDFDLDGDGHDSIQFGGLDCDDQAPDRHPDAVETYYDGVDQNCDGRNDFDQDEDGFDFTGASDGDCNDQESSIYPGAEEVWYDGVDQNCDGANDFDRDADGFESDEYEGLDCDDKDQDAYPGATEVWYDGIDQDCLGGDDFDQDGDGFGVNDRERPDCNDLDATIFPGAVDSPSDRIDQDCDGVDAGPVECSSVSASGLLVWLLPALFVRRRQTG